jgi:hypothetical protein
MKLIRPRFIQENCVEGNRTDLRQANVVRKYRPDIILFELPAERGNPSLMFNRYSPDKKPLKEISKMIHEAKIAARRFPYALSDARTFENIEKLWRAGHNVLLFNIDGPRAIRRDYWNHYGSLPYDSQRKKLIFWVHCYLRETQMASRIRHILKNYEENPDPIIAVFLQSIHWHHVKFLLKDPSQKEIWKYYFGRFPKINPANIGPKIKKIDAVHYEYWQKAPLGRAS